MRHFYRLTIISKSSIRFRPSILQGLTVRRGAYDVQQIIEALKSFKGHVIVQSLFMIGTSEGQSVDNTTDEYVKPWLQALQEIQPSGVMVYTIDRETPDPDLRKASPEQLDHIADQVRALGLAVEVAY